MEKSLSDEEQRSVSRYSLIGQDLFDFFFCEFRTLKKTHTRKKTRAMCLNLIWKYKNLFKLQ